ncbi:MAG: (2Fe-2S)-binding protein [Bdellovibrionales bacterium]|nr:(2Fe-2S)-binding protein [Bdellovibrionales bacterium]
MGIQGKIRAEILGRDLIELKELPSGEQEVHFVGCAEFARQVSDLKLKYGLSPQDWVFTNDLNHNSLLLKEFILKCRGEWKVVYEAQELCHCRNVPTQAVEQAILCGARTSEQVSQWTSASTACGTCRSHVEEILRARISLTQLAQCQIVKQS